MLYSGGCHCEKVRFEVEAPELIEAERCNCSICVKSGFLHLIVPKRRFNLIAGADAITTYTFNTAVAQHTFCRHCGVKSFYIPRSNPDGVDVNVNCLDTTPTSINIIDFDGQHWEDNAHRLRHKTYEKD